MASLKKFNLGPIALTNTLTTNIMNPGTTTGGVNGGGSGNLKITMYHFKVTNKTGGAVTFSLYKGATGANTAGTEFLGTAMSVPANSALDFYSPTGWEFLVADFLVGGASAATSLVISGEGEIGVA